MTGRIAAGPVAVLVAVLAGSLGGATAVRAQGTGVTVQGIAYDSVRREVLPNAFVTLAGRASVTTDGRGRFAFADVAPGTHVIEMQHARLDSMGLPGISVRARVTDGSEAITVAIPSFATLWRAACGDRPAPPDSGFVYGTVRDARSGARVADAAIQLAWVDLAVNKDPAALSMQQRLVRSETNADANGEFSVCGVPLDAGLRLVAAGDSTVSGIIDLPATTLPIQRFDLIVGTADRTDSTSLGDLSAEVLGTDGKPIEGARVIVDDVPRGTTSADGRLFVRGVLPGTRQVEVLMLGRRPSVLAVVVASQRTTTLHLELERLTQLDVVRVIGSPFQQRLLQELADHKKMGFGAFLDSTMVGRRGTIESVFGALAGVELTRQRYGGFQIALPYRKGGKCAAVVWIDGIRSDTDFLKSIRPSDIAVVEIFKREYNVPDRYWTPRSDCGAVAVWTKRGIS
jgi:hypothetical protein